MRSRTIIAADRSVVRSRSRQPDDANLRSRLRELAGQRRRFGYRRLHVLLRGEGWPVNRKKTQRLYRERGLAVRRRIAVARTNSASESRGAEQPLVGRLVHDQLASGRRFWVLTIIDDVAKECLAAVPDTSIIGRRGCAR